MVHIEVELKEGDKEPEQHLDEGEHIERIVVPISELYDKLQGTSHLCRKEPSWPQKPTGISCTQHFRRRRAKSWTPGKLFPTTLL